jgi:hypothetical protein
LRSNRRRGSSPKRKKNPAGRSQAGLSGIKGEFGAGLVAGRLYLFISRRAEFQLPLIEWRIVIRKTALRSENATARQVRLPLPLPLPLAFAFAHDIRSLKM